MDKDNNIQLRPEDMIVSEFENENFFDKADMIQKMDPMFFQMLETIKKMDPKFFQVYDMIRRDYENNNILSRDAEMQSEETINRGKL